MVQRRYVWKLAELFGAQKICVVNRRGLLACICVGNIRYLENVREFYNMIVLEDVEYEISLGIYRSYGICNLCGRCEMCVQF